MNSVQNPAVAQAFDAFPIGVRRQLLALRALIFHVAAITDDVAAIEETLRWGERVYITSQSKSGSTIRIGWKISNPSQYAIYFNCWTNLVQSFRALFLHEFKFQGNRAMVFEDGEPLPKDALCFCIAAALTYHLDRGNMKLKSLSKG